MSRAIFEKPLADLSWSDFQNIISTGLEEDQTLEFKETLPAKDGNTDPWQGGQSKIGNYARDTLAKEAVAFANAYGGVIIAGARKDQAGWPSHTIRRSKAYSTFYPASGLSMHRHSRKASEFEGNSRKTAPPSTRASRSATDRRFTCLPAFWMGTTI